MLAVMGPGLMACLADTDGPCLLTAAQSGAQWGYALLALQLALVPVLFSAQELTARLGIVRGMGMTAMLRQDVGPIAAWLVSTPLLAACVLGLLSEFSIIGQTMTFWGVPVWASNSAVSLTLLSVAATGSYAVAETAGLAMGICQVAFFLTMFMAAPKLGSMAEGLVRFPLDQPEFVKLVTANIGAVIMPWMLAYQQSAICNKGIGQDRRRHLQLARIDTGFGSLLTQGVMAAMLVTVAASSKQLGSVGTVHDLVVIFTSVLGNEFRAKMLLTFAIVGACMVAAIVQTLCAAWTFEQAMGRATATLPPESDESAGLLERVVQNVRARPLFYVAYTVVCAGAFTFTLVMDNAVDLSIWTEFCNGVLMPPVIFTLWYLAAFRLPPEYKLGICYRWIVFVVFLVCSLFCVGSIFDSLRG